VSIVHCSHAAACESSINIKNCKALLKKVVIGRAVTALKQQKSKGKGKAGRERDSGNSSSYEAYNTIAS
jgi:hypothetical protein